MSETEGSLPLDVADPFQDIKPSEFVAHLLDGESTDYVYTEEFDIEEEEEECQHYISFIDYKEEP